MIIERCGKKRNHGIAPICSSISGYKVKIHPIQVGKIMKRYIKIELDKDIEKSGGGEHRHFARMEIDDVARIIEAISNVISEDQTLAEELAEKLGHNVTGLERIKLAILGAL